MKYKVQIHFEKVVTAEDEEEAMELVARELQSWLSDPEDLDSITTVDEA
jgi:hypothetical protein